MGPFRALWRPVLPAHPAQEFRRDAHDAPVAQLDRAPDYESGGQEFESLRARQIPPSAAVSILAVPAAPA